MMETASPCLSITTEVLFWESWLRTFSDAGATYASPSDCRDSAQLEKQQEKPESTVKDSDDRNMNERSLSIVSRRE